MEDIWESIQQLKFTNTFNEGEIFTYIKDEFFGILEKPNPNYPRTIEHIFDDCKMGAVAEMTLIRDFGFTRNPKRYHDLISPCGIETEVKAFRKCTPVSIDTAIERARNWNKASVWIFFQFNNGTYTFYTIKEVK
jgi:hypothetical protein